MCMIVRQNKKHKKCGMRVGASGARLGGPAPGPRAGYFRFDTLIGR